MSLLQKVALVALSLSSVFLQASSSSAYKQGEKFAEHFLDAAVTWAKGSRGDLVKLQQFMPVGIKGKEVSKFAQAAVIGLKKISIAKAVRDYQLTQQQHAGILAIYYAAIETFSMIAKSKWKTLKKAVQKNMVNVIYEAGLRGTKEVFGINSLEYKMYQAGKKVIVHQLKDDPSLQALAFV